MLFQTGFHSELYIHIPLSFLPVYKCLLHHDSLMLWFEVPDGVVACWCISNAVTEIHFQQISHLVSNGVKNEKNE